MTVGAVVILTEEYKELIEKSLKYDELREMALKSGYLTSEEKRIFKINETDLKKEGEA